MEHEHTTHDAIGALAARVEQLGQAVAGQGTELRTQRLVVVDHKGTERIVGEVATDGTAELRIDLPGAQEGRRSSLLAFADPGIEAIGLPPGAGVQIWMDGAAARELDAWRDAVG